MKNGLRCSLLLCAMVYPLACVAAAFGDSYAGTLMPATFERPVPIKIDVRDSGGSLWGSVQTSSPMTSSPEVGPGPHYLGEKRAEQCEITADLGNQLTLHMLGICKEKEGDYRGSYTVFHRDLTIRQGTFVLNRVKTKKDKKALTEAERQMMASSSNTACLRSNSHCLAGCTRGVDVNAEFLCANACRRKLVTCRAKGKKAVDAELAKTPE
jgi:hypothetical protein